MKKEKDYTLLLLLIIFVISCLCSCNESRSGQRKREMIDSSIKKDTVKEHPRDVIFRVKASSGAILVAQMDSAYKAEDVVILDDGVVVTVLERTN